MIEELEARLRVLNAQIETEKSTTGDVSVKTALDWWDTATALRDLREERQRATVH
jgi:hypothetical protein